jgi:hypothetical protein
MWQRIALLIGILAPAAAFAADPVQSMPLVAPPVPASVLPQQFAGWKVKDAVEKNSDPVAADPTNAAVLKEYGFERLEKATYTRDDGSKLAIKAAVFDDATGSYGAFTFYKTPEMLNEKIGGQASSVNNRVFFYQGNVLVDAVFDKLTVMSAAELRELATVLPPPPGNTGNLPSLPTYLPKAAYEKNTAKYVAGPVTLERVGGPLPGNLVNFKSGAEVVLGQYSVAKGDATLMLIAYPTPQIAMERVREIEAARQSPAQPGAAAPPNIAPFFDKRTGPIVVVASGPLTQNEANGLLASVNYEADVTWNENTYASKKNNVANLLVNVILLCGIVIGLALVAGVAFGGVRLLVKRLFPDRFFDRPQDTEIITLHLDDRAEQAAARR